jgi:hypothetical protein
VCTISPYNTHRIVQDCYRVVHCLKGIVKAGGKVVPGLSNRNGHRRRKGDNKKRKLFENEDEEVIPSMSDIGMFIETQEVAKEMIAFETARFERHQKQREQVEDLVDDLE